MSKRVAIGIDLGTTYSCVAVWNESLNRVETIANDLGCRTTPSYVAFTETERLIGNSAKNQVSMNPENTIFDAKRVIGRQFTDSVVQSDMKHWPFKVTRGDNGQCQFKVMYKDEEQTFKPEQISAMVLGKMKDVAETYLGQPVTDVVITVPAYFNDAQRQATSDAGVIAGLNVLRIINEPTAAALCYGFEQTKKAESKVLVFDLGGGTFDVSVLEISDGMFEVKATSGDTHLGGEDFDNRMVDYFAEEFKRKTGSDLRSSNRSLRRLRTSCERAKQTLSSSVNAVIEIDSLFEGQDFNSTISRAKFEDLCLDLFKKCLGPVEQVLKDSKLGKGDIDEIILVGGSTRIPKVQQLLKDFFNGKELNKSVNPDEAVAHGAALQSYILSGGKSNKTTDMLLVDVTSLSLGVEAQGKIMAVVVPRNTTIPCKKSQTFSTASHNQEIVSVCIYEGERKLTKDCNPLGKFHLSGIRPAPQGVPQIEVEFSLDANGLLTVTACEKGSDRKEQITVTNDKAKLSAEEIQRMIADSEKFKTEDEANVQRIEAQQKLNQLTRHVQDELNKPEFKQKVGEDDLKKVREKCQEIQNWLNNTTEPSKDECEAKQKELEQTFYPLMSQMPQSDDTSFESSPTEKPSGPKVEEVD